MRRRRRATDEDSYPDRWIVSYADFITLLFAFFIVMYAISTLNEGKYRAVGNALGFAFAHSRVAAPPVIAQLPQALPPTMPPQIVPRVQPRPYDAVRYAREQKLSGIAAMMTDALSPLVQTGQVRLRKSAAGLVIEIDASVLFAPGQATLQPDSIAALTAAAKVVADIEHSIQIEGHTDSQPMSSSAFPSNWELASARASSVVRLFAANGVDPARLLAVGFADNRPVDTNDTPEGRAKNRRVTLLILADPGGAGEVMPVSEPASRISHMETVAQRATSTPAIDAKPR